MTNANHDVNPYDPPPPCDAVDEDSLSQIIARTAEGTRFPVEAYLFTLQGFEFARTHVQHPQKPPYGEGHFDAVDLCWCLHDYALHLYGESAREQLAQWGIRRTRDFGDIEFELIRSGLVQKSDESESADDYADVFDFDEEFDHGKNPREGCEDP